MFRSTNSSHSGDRNLHSSDIISVSASSTSPCNIFHLVDPLAMSTVSTITARCDRSSTNSLFREF